MASTDRLVSIKADETFPTRVQAAINVLIAAGIPIATTVVAGKVRLATTGETTTGTDATIATTPAGVKAAVDAAVSGLLNGAPGALDTLKELADAINDDASFAATVTTALASKVNSSTYTAGLAGKQSLQQVATTVSVDGAAVVNKHNPVDATSANRAITLPTGQAEGTQISVEKTDTSLNTVGITGNIRGVGSSALTLYWQYESVLLRADSAGSWWPVAGHKTKTALDGAYARTGSLPMAKDRPALLYPDHLRRARGKLAAALDRQFTIGVYGHSIVDGIGADGTTGTTLTVARDKAWPSIIRRTFATQYGDPGEGYFGAFGTSKGIFTAAGTPAPVATGPQTSYGFAGYYWAFNAGSGTLTMNAPACTQIDILGFNDTGIPLTYSLDGGADTNIVAGSGHWTHSITGLADTTHTLVIKAPASGGTRGVTGVSVRRKTTSGVVVHRCGWQSKVLADMFRWADSGDAGASTSKDSQLQSCTSRLGVDLAVIMTDVNDTSTATNHGFTPAQITTNLNTLISKLQALNIDTLLVCGPTKDPAAVNTTSNQAAYIDAYRQAAQANDRVGFLDLTQIQDSYADSNADGFYVDYVHPTLVGHSYIAKATQLAITSA